MSAVSRRTTGAALAIAAIATSSMAYAQRIWVGGGGFSREAARFAKAEDFDGSFLYCRGMYQSTWREAGGQGWRTDYPGADNNFSVRLAELTRVPVRWDPDRQPRHVVVALDDPLLYRCPILFLEDVGTLELSAEEVRSLREYLLKGGFLWVDDFWGTAAWNQWVAQISRVLPGFQIFDIPISHPVMHTLYDVESFLQVPSIQFWYQSRGRVSERGSDSAEVHYRGIQDASGRLMVYITHNTDVADTWEREGENTEYFDLYSPRGYAIGVNAVVYALTH